jgi:hypothetical protein
MVVDVVVTKVVEVEASAAAMNYRVLIAVLPQTKKFIILMIDAEDSCSRTARVSIKENVSINIKSLGRWHDIMFDKLAMIQ